MAAEKDWRSQGIDFVTDFNALRQQVEAGKSPRHQFLVLNNQENQLEPHWDWLSQYVNCLPYRIIVVGNMPENFLEHLNRTMIKVELDELARELRKSKPDGLKVFLWRKWVQHWCSNFTLCVRGIGNRDKHGTIAESFFVQGEDDPEEIGLLVYDHQPNSDGTDLFGAAAFHECFTGDTPTDHLLKSGGKPWMRWRVKEAAAISAGVLDERIFLEKDNIARVGVEKYSPTNQNIINAWEKRRVHIFNHIEAIDDFANFLTNPKCPPLFDFFIIHQGIIDEVKMRDQEKGTNKFSEGWKSLKTVTRWLIIDTGRGRPDQAIKECLRWVEYSSLADCLMQRAADKYNLVQILFALQAEFTKVEEV